MEPSLFHLSERDIYRRAPANHVEAREKEKKKKTRLCGGVLSQKQRAAQIEFPLWITDWKMISIHGLSDLTDLITWMSSM